MHFNSLDDGGQLASGVRWGAFEDFGGVSIYINDGEVSHLGSFWPQYIP